MNMAQSTVTGTRRAYSTIVPPLLGLSISFRWATEAERNKQMATATWNGVVLATSDQTVIVEGNHYFPIEAIQREYFRPSDHRTTCPWKGVANYYDIVVDDQVNKDAAWYYPEPKEAAKQIKDHIAFWRGVKVVSGTVG